MEAWQTGVGSATCISLKNSEKAFLLKSETNSTTSTWLQVIHSQMVDAERNWADVPFSYFQSHLAEAVFRPSPG